jgi:hypothetical protein
MKLKTGKRFLLAAMLLLAAPSLSLAQFTFVTNNGTITITGATGSPTNLNIPSITNGWPVTSIGSGAFEYSVNLNNVTIPDSVTNISSYAFSDCGHLTNLVISTNVLTIGDWAFADTVLTNFSLPGSLVQIGNYAFDCCSGLASIVVPNSVTSVGSSAFYSCVNATNIYLGSSVTNIGQYAFTYCPQLQTLSVDPSNSMYTSQDNVIFDKAMTSLICCMETKSGSYTVPAGILNIAPSAFFRSALSSIILPDSLTNIGGDAFGTCVSLTNMIIGPGLLPSEREPFRLVLASRK